MELLVLATIYNRSMLGHGSTKIVQHDVTKHGMLAARPRSRSEANRVTRPTMTVPCFRHVCVTKGLDTLQKMSSYKSNYVMLTFDQTPKFCFLRLWNAQLVK